MKLQLCTESSFSATSYTNSTQTTNTLTKLKLLFADRTVAILGFFSGITPCFLESDIALSAGLGNVQD